MLSALQIMYSLDMGLVCTSQTCNVHLHATLHICTAYDRPLWDDALQKFRSEIHTHQAAVHQHIVRFERTFEDAKNHYVLMELCENQTLYDVLKRRGRLLEPEAKYYMLQLIRCRQAALFQRGHNTRSGSMAV